MGKHADGGVLSKHAGRQDHDEQADAGDTGEVTPFGYYSSRIDASSSSSASPAVPTVVTVPEGDVYIV